MDKLFLFDCDQTIWINSNKDYISSVTSPLKLSSGGKIYRVYDQSIFSLKPGVSELFSLIKRFGYTIGIISDNRKDMVIKALKLFNLYKFIDKEAVNIRLWDGYCPKHLMINEILEMEKFKVVFPKDVYWFDDKDYSREASLIRVNFIKVNNDSDMTKIVKELVC